MSDYLWDKTGEPEEDVAQLEHLLGALKYRPRPLDIPASAMPTATAATAATRTRPASAVIFSRPRLALAASLLLTLLAGVWLMTRQGEPQTNPLASGGPGSASAGNGQTVVVTPAVPNNAAHRDAADDRVEPSRPREDRAVAPSLAGVRRPARLSVVKRQKHLHPRTAEHTPAPREEMAIVNGTTRWQVEQPLTPRQREATEQLMLALRLASAQLNYAQREMQEIGRAGK